MKYVKMLGLLAVAGAAMMAFAGTASATTPTCAHVVCTPTIHATSHGHTSLHGSNGVTVECPFSTVQGKVESHGTAATAEGKLTALVFGGTTATTACTHGEIVHVLKLGRLIAHTIENGPNATLTSSGTEVEITTTIFGFPVSCIYNTGENLHIGVVTGAATTTSHATFHISANIPRTGGSGLCGESGVWTGGYTIDSPVGLTFH
jgi:hypothetical protein